ncbi:MAG: type IV pilus modification PilV family protein [Phycisphaeraceae bacterium]
MRDDRSNNFSRCASAGITLLETVMSLVILGGAFVAALNTIVSARGAQAIVAHRQVGLVLAEDLMAEILAQTTYKEGITIGPDIGEATGDRDAFDDIDDYHGWSANPPEDVAGTPILGMTEYTRSVVVDYVDVDSISDAVAIDQGLARIVVTVKWRDKTVATLKSYRSDLWQAPAEGY